MIIRTVWMYWDKGWENAPWLQQRIRESWEINNPSWKINCLDKNSVLPYLSEEVKNILFDSEKRISPAAESDIIRVNLLRFYGGIWVDATFLCLQPMDSWIHKALNDINFWTYSSGGSICNWFIISDANNLIINEYYKKVIEYWSNRNTCDKYHWLDGIFRELLANNIEFKREWNKVQKKSLYDKDHAAILYGDEKLLGSSIDIKNIIRERPPYGLKLSKNFESHYKDKSDTKCMISNTYYAIMMSKRKIIYDHPH